MPLKKHDEEMTETSSVLAGVKPQTSRMLPQNLDLAHAVAFFFHDQLAQLVVDLERTDALFVHLDLSGDERKELTNLKGEELWRWLTENGREDIINDLTYRQLTAAVVSDAAHFICESLIASAKGKTQVAYTLLRKPLKENLLLLEWLAAAPSDFLEKFHGDSVWPYVLNRLPKESRIEIIDTASSLAAIPGLDEDFMWTVRYAKGYENSLETLWTKATHLVTTVEASATEPGNLNFVFSTRSAIEEQWEHYYRIVPLLLYYFVNIGEEVASRFVEWDTELRPTQLMLRDLAFLRYSETYGTDVEAESANQTNELLQDLNSTAFKCAACSEEVSVGASGIDRFWLHAELICPECAEHYNLWDLIANPEDADNGT